MAQIVERVQVGKEALTREDSTMSSAGKPRDRLNMMRIHV